MSAWPIPGLWAAILHPEDRERVLTESERTNVTGDPFDLEYRVVRKDGATAWLHDHASLVTGPDGVPIWQGVLQDVTAQRAAADALARRDAILEATGFAAARFLAAESWLEVLDEVLARLGAAAGAGRAYVDATLDHRRRRGGHAAALVGHPTWATRRRSACTPRAWADGPRSSARAARSTARWRSSRRASARSSSCRAPRSGASSWCRSRSTANGGARSGSTIRSGADLARRRGRRPGDNGERPGRRDRPRAGRASLPDADRADPRRDLHRGRDHRAARPT